MIILMTTLSGCAVPPLQLRFVENPIPPTPTGVSEINTVSVIPQLLIQASTVYPYVFRKRNIGGESLIWFIVRADGSVTNAAIVKATEIHFGEAARDAILHYRFSPALVDGKPVDCAMTLPIIFSADPN